MAQGNYHTGNVFPLVQVTKIEPDSGNRLCRVIRKGKKGEKASTESQGVFISAATAGILPVALNNSTVEGYLLQAFHDLQDKVVRSLLDKGQTTVAAYDYNVESCAQWIIANVATSERISGELVCKWFDEALASQLAEKMQEKGLQDAVITAKLASYRTAFANMAKKEWHYSSEDYPMLEKAMLFADEENSLTEIVAARFINCKPITAADLGF